RPILPRPRRRENWSGIGRRKCLIRCPSWPETAPREAPSWRTSGTNHAPGRDDMQFAQPYRIHPTAIISPEAELADDVQIGAHAVLEGPVRVGAGCVIRPGAYLFGPLTMGCHNQVCTHAVLGEQPQHVKYGGEATRVEIGDHNIFRE